MSKVTSKLQVTIPKVLAETYGIGPGSEISFEPAGEAIRVLMQKRHRREGRLDIADRLRLFDEAMARADARSEGGSEGSSPTGPGHERGWTREELYEDRGLPR